MSAPPKAASANGKTRKGTVSLQNGEMDLEEQLLVEHSRHNTDRIVQWIGADASRLARFMKVFLSSDPLLTQRAAWVVGVFVDSHPGILQPWLTKMLRKMQEPGVHDAVPRNVMRALQFMEIPQRQLGNVAAACFHALASGGTPLAVKASAMTVLARIVEREPGLAREVRLMIEQQLPYGAASFHARARKILASLPEANGAPSED